MYAECMKTHIRTHIHAYLQVINVGNREYLYVFF